MFLGTMVLKLKCLKTNNVYSVNLWFRDCNGWQYFQIEPEDCYNMAKMIVSEPTVFGQTKIRNFDLQKCFVNQTEFAMGTDLKNVKPPKGYEWICFDIVD